LKKIDFKKIRDTLLGINDTPNRIALGVGLGLFLGVFPGTGAVAAIVCAFILRVNKAAALGSALLINTWINFVTFPIALAIGAFLFRLNATVLKTEWSTLIQHFTWRAFLDTVLRDTILAMFTGYSLIGLGFAVVGYFISYYIIKKTRRKKNDTVST